MDTRARRHPGTAEIRLISRNSPSSTLHSFFSAASATSDIRSAYGRIRRGEQIERILEFGYCLLRMNAGLSD